MTSPFISQIIERRAQARAEFDDWHWAAYCAAENALNGALLNRRGHALGIDAVSLFMGNTTRAYAYASEELRDWWATHTRPVFAHFYEQWIQQFDNPDDYL